MFSFQDYATYFSHTDLWDYIDKIWRLAGRKVLRLVLILYYALIDNDTPLWAKGVITGALGYFIWPFDLIPDAIPFIGFSDDLAVLVSAIAIIAVHIKPEHRQRADKKLSFWFGL